jgi:hypothetical protein
MSHSDPQQKWNRNCPVPECKVFDTLPTARPLTIRHIAYLNLLEREPSRLRRIGVDSTVKLAECRSLDTALLQQGATVVR